MDGWPYKRPKTYCGTKYSRQNSFISRALQSLYFLASWVRHHPQYGVTAIRLLILLTTTCQLCG